MGKRPSAVEGLDLSYTFWRGKRVFLTGHTGFKGSWLSLWLQNLGAQLHGYALPAPTEPNLFKLARVGEGMTSIIGDVRDGPALTVAMLEAAPEIVIHMAAQPLVRYSYSEPVETYATNVMGAVNLFEAVRQSPSVKAVINVTTDKCYENREWVWPYRENEPMGGHDPYSSSKACAELVTSAYRSSFFNIEKDPGQQVAIASARAGNVIGGGDWAADRLIPDTLRAFVEGKVASIRNPQAIRPWQHVLEPLRGYLILAERLFEEGPKFGQAFNFGPRLEDARPVLWVVDRLAAMWGDEVTWEVCSAHHPHEANYLRLDISKAAHLLSWTPCLDLEEALALTVSWTAEQRRGRDARSLTLEQIEAYTALTGTAA